MDVLESLLLLEVELMETKMNGQFCLYGKKIASIIGSGINGNSVRKSLT